jgi:DNA polymerase-4
MAFDGNVPDQAVPDKAVFDKAVAQQYGNDSGCTVLHVDMDAFFVSVELRRRPELAGKPVIVGGLSGRGVVCSASYEARAFGVTSAMPTGQARRLCPQAVFLPVDGAAYREASTAVMAVFGQFTPLVEPLSLDEAFLDVAGARRRLGTPAAIGAAIRDQMSAVQQLPCSVGVARNKFVAKLASQHAKPDGMLVVPAAKTLEFLHPLPVHALWGVGRQTRTALEHLGIRTVADLANYPRSGLRQALGQVLAAGLHELAHGRDPRRVRTDRIDKSIGAEQTFAVDLTSHPQLRRELLRLAETVGGRLRAANYHARTIGLKLRFGNFSTVNRTRTLPHPTDGTQALYQVAIELLDCMALDRPRVRLLGLRAENVSPASSGRQLALGEPDRGWREADAAVDAVTRKFGTGAIGRLGGKAY